MINFTYSFDTDIATAYSIDEAIMIKNMQFWIAKNKANNKNFYDGHYWTYNSHKALQELFPFWSEQNIKTILKKLKDKKVIITGNYNNTPYDKTTWYAFLDENKWIGENQIFDKLELTNRTVRTNQPIPDIIPDIIPDNINFGKRESFLSAKPEDLLRAIKRDIVPNLAAYLYTGKEPSDEQLRDYLQKRIATNWEKNGGGFIRNVGSDLACWLKNPLAAKQGVKIDDTEIQDFVSRWNKEVFDCLKAVSKWTKVEEATADGVKDLVANAKKTLCEIIENTKRRIVDKPPFLKPKVGYDDIWGFGFNIASQRRFISTFLYNEVNYTPKFFCSHIQELCDPYSDAYIDESKKWCHE